MNRKKNSEGYALMLALILLSFIITGSTLLLGMASQNAFIERKRMNHLKAKMIAEAGVRLAYGRLRNDPALFDTPFEEVSLNGGTIQTVVTKQPAGEGVGDAILRATGTIDGIESSAAIAIAYTEGADAASGDGAVAPPVDSIMMLFQSAMFCGKDANMTGGSYIDLNGGTAHINGTLRMVGSAAFNNNGQVSSSTGITLTGGAKINADAAAPNISIPNWASTAQFISGSATEGDVPEQFIEIDLQPFCDYAKARDISGDYSKKLTWNAVITDPYISADELKNGMFQLNANQTLRPQGGVVWIEGEVKLNGSSIVEGCVISTGDIKVCGGMTHINANGLPSYMSQSGDVNLQSGCVAYGLLYSHTGDIRIGGNATVEGGAFICPRGSFTHNGSGKIHYTNCFPLGPNGEDVTLPNIVETVITDSGELPVPVYMGWIE